MSRLVWIVCATLLAYPTWSAAADLSVAQGLYLSASYEEALTALEHVDASEGFEQVNQIRALCLLALGRTTDAEQAVAAIVLRNPSHTVSIGNLSPKFVTLFNDVRRRTLPSAVRAIYATARSAYEAKQWVDAKRDFDRVVAALSEPSIVADQPTLGDLRELADGFSRLSAGELAMMEAARLAPPPAPAEPQPAIVSTPAPSVANTTLVYSAMDREVTPPLERRRTMPPWSPPPALIRMTMTGQMEVIIDQGGRVEQATILRKTTPAYDDALVRAAQDWLFVPARKDGRPVRYRHTFDIVLRTGS